jgi:hypothetical protein
MNALSFECRKVALKQDRTGYILTLSMHPDEIPEELFRDYVGSRYMCALARIEDDETPKIYNNRVKKAGMICRQPLFHKWLREENSLTIDGEDDAVDALYNICLITSRTELNGNSDAQQKFDEMVEEYERWKEEGEPF